PGVTNPTSVTGDPSYASGRDAVANTLDHSPTPNVVVSATPSVGVSAPANRVPAASARDIASSTDNDAGGSTSAAATTPVATTPAETVPATVNVRRRDAAASSPSSEE